MDNQPPLLTRGVALPEAVGLNYDYARVGPASPQGGRDLVTQDYFRQPMPASPQLPSDVEGARGCSESQPGYGRIGHQPNPGATGPSGWPHGQGAWPEYLNSSLVRHEERPPKFDANVDDWHHYIRAFEAVTEIERLDRTSYGQEVGHMHDQVGPKVRSCTTARDAGQLFPISGRPRAELRPA